MNADTARSAPRMTLHGVRLAAAPPSWPALALAAGVSLALHLAAMAALTPARERVQIEGGAPPALAGIGNAFEDFVEGAAPVTPPTAATTAPRPMASSAPPVLLAPVSEATPPPPAPPAFSDPVALAVPLAPAEPEPSPTPPVAQPTLSPSAAAEAAQPTQAEVTTSEESPAITVNEATPDTPRAPPRPDPSARTRTAAPSQPAGNAPQTTRRGTEAGRTDAPAAPSGAASAPAATSGTAAATNYPGAVLQQLQRTRRARVSGRGVAMVVFTIADNGGLAAVSISSSSGSAALDQAALDHIRRTAPFPPPPAGAQRQFRFEFVSR